MKKFFYLAAIMFAAVFASCTSDDNAGGGSKEEEKRGTETQYTFMMYACGGGDLDYSVISELYQAYSEVSKTEDKVRFVGIYKASKECQDNLSGTTYFELTPNDGVTDETITAHLQDMQQQADEGSQRSISNKWFGNDFKKAQYADATFKLFEPANIAAAIKYMAEKAPAKKYVLITDDHGGGWKFTEDAPLAKGQVFDDNVTDADGNATGISAEQLCEGVKQSGVSFSVLFDDLCLMATIENLYTYANYNGECIFPICVASAETTTGSQIGQLAIRLSELGGNASHDKLYNECRDWVITKDDTGYKRDFATYAEMNASENTDCQDMGCYDLKKIGTLTEPLNNIAKWYTTSMGDATLKPIIQKSVMTTLYTTLPFGQEDLKAYKAYRKTMKALGYDKNAEGLAEAIIANNTSSSWTPDAEYYSNQGSMQQGYPLAYFVKHTIDLLTAAGKDASTLKGYYDAYLTALKEMSGIVCSHSDFPGMDAYVYTSPTVVITSLNNNGFQDKKGADKLLSYSPWADGIDLTSALNVYNATAFDTATKWSDFLQKLDINPSVLTNPFRCVPMYDKQGASY